MQPFLNMVAQFPFPLHPGSNWRNLRHGQTKCKTYLYIFAAISAVIALSSQIKNKQKNNNKLITLSVLACHCFSHSHLFSFSQLETREKASNIQPLCSLEVGESRDPSLEMDPYCRYGFLNALAIYIYCICVFYHQKNTKCIVNMTVKRLNKSADNRIIPLDLWALYSKIPKSSHLFSPLKKKKI